MTRQIRLKSSYSTLWKTIRKHSYSQKALQALCELIDNAITSVNEMITQIPKYSGKIEVTIDFENQTASIEDNGTGFPNDEDKLSVAFSYGCPNPHGLSEHGCGLPAALSIFDESNRDWKIFWKNGDSKIYKLEAPMQDCITIEDSHDDWIGNIHDNTGVFIQFPFPEECTDSLYTKSAPRKKDVEDRMKQLFKQIYMYEPSFKEGKIRLFVNGEEIRPFQFSHDDVEYIKSIPTINLTSGGNVDITLVKIKENIKDSWFKSTQGACGIYTWKCGRHIQHIHSGLLFEKLSNRTMHPQFSGKFVLISMSGKQEQLPATDPTKSTINETDPLFQELCNSARDQIHAFFAKFGIDDLKEDEKQERDLIVDFRNMRDTQFKDLEGIDYKYEVNKTLGLSPPIDFIETINKNITIYEAKKDNKASISSVLQLYGNYILASKNLEERQIKDAVLLINAEKGSRIINDNLVAQIKSLDSAYKFPIQIKNYKGELLWSIKT
jgi:Histidine kinase-, DNA gyrase B-, and HSP90-like ATPase